MKYGNVDCDWVDLIEKIDNNTTFIYAIYE